MHALAPAIEITQLELKLGAKKILHGVDLCVEPGALYGLLGRNGAGKTTTMRAALGLQGFTKGVIKLFGADVSSLPSLPQALGVALDPPGLDDTLSVRQNLEIARIRGGIRGGRSIDEVLELVGLTHRQHNYGSRLSHGQGRRAAVARALLGDPELLMLDEPLSGLDPQGVERMLDLFQTLSRDEGKTVVLSSHHLREVQHVCTHVGLIDDGRTLLQGSTAELLSTMPSHLVVRSSQPDAVLSFLSSAANVINVAVVAGEVIAEIDSSFDSEKTLGTMNGIPVSEFFVKHSSLVDVFQQTVNEEDLRSSLV
jgi:ABC-type multidrug transport system ATPase subunit